MSNKPVKKSDINKPWKRDRRDRARLINPEYHLIVTEGTKTEPQQFEGLKKEINFTYPGRIDIRIEGIGEGCNTKWLVEKAADIQQRSGGRFQHIWVVYDKDDFSDTDFNEAVAQCAKRSDDEVSFHALWSNQCIELWFLLHFSYSDSDLHREEYFPKLTQRLGTKYMKNREDIYSELRDKLGDAIRNSKALISSHGDNSPAKSSPATTVYEIFEKLSPYLKIKKS